MAPARCSLLVPVGTEVDLVCVLGAKPGTFRGAKGHGDVSSCNARWGIPPTVESSTLHQSPSPGITEASDPRFMASGRPRAAMGAYVGEVPERRLARDCLETSSVNYVESPGKRLLLDMTPL